MILNITWDLLGIIWLAVRVILIILAISSVLILVRTFTLTRRRKPLAPVEGLPVDAAAIGEHLAAAIRCKTVPLDEQGTPDPAAFKQLHELLEKLYPRVHATLKLEKVNGYSLLYTWQGTRPDLQPVQMMAHQDVVAAGPETLSEWKYPPFEGRIVDGILWGRGSLDIKNQVIGVLEAAEGLLAQGYRPERTILFAFGHDEETGGANGARNVAKLLRERGIRLAGVVDEGGGIMAGIIPRIKGDVALIGTGEKGYLTLEFTVQCAPGHSSAPPKQTAIGILARAMVRLEEKPFSPQIKSARPLYWALGTAVPFTAQLAWANPWLFGRRLERVFGNSDETKAYFRTTTAVTVFHAGDEDNTLPAEAKALVNFRLLPGMTIAGACERIRRVIDDERVEFKPVEGKANEVVGPSPVNCPAYEGLSRAVQQIYGPIPEAPFVMLGGTDCGHYRDLSDYIYRFTPLVMDPSFSGLEHGIGERIPVASMAKTVQFYAHLMQVWGTESMT